MTTFIPEPPPLPLPRQPDGKRAYVAFVEVVTPVQYMIAIVIPGEGGHGIQEIERETAIETAVEMVKQLRLDGHTVEHNLEDYGVTLE